MRRARLLSTTSFPPDIIVPILHHRLHHIIPHLLCSTMGNSNAKESRSGDNPEAGPDGRGESSRSRNRLSRADFSSFLNIQPSSRDRHRDRQTAPFERRETKQEREARRLERDRAIRAKERERSLREEHVDGGYLVTLGTYTGIEDFSKPVVRQLQVRTTLSETAPCRLGGILTCCSIRLKGSSLPSGVGLTSGLQIGPSTNLWPPLVACPYLLQTRLPTLGSFPSLADLSLGT